ncbi:stage II sporulation protein P [Sporosarcina luteola]|nr:stage II sporulation protein P [Sporosarcina luteola]
MKKSLQVWIAAIVTLFLFPIVMQFLPEGTSVASTKIMKDNAFIVYASNVMEETEPVKEDTKAKVLLYFTHSHEAYEPMTKAADGKVATNHQTENIMKLGEKLKSQLIINGIDASTLDIDNSKEIRKKGIHYSKSYAEIRPHVKKAISEQPYDLVIDVHRDAVGPEKTTIVHEGERYAKVAFVLGTDHPQYKQNMQNVLLVKRGMENLVPGITRNIIQKGGPGVDGKYNQDLDPSVILIELGGIGNTEDELNRTIAIIAEAIAQIMAAKEEETISEGAA